MKKILPVCKVMCPTCPFRDEGWTEVHGLLQMRALSEATPICHSTGSTALVKKKKRTSRTQALCRGARDFQIQIFHRIGFLEAPTDEAWQKKADELARKNFQRRRFR